jgi:antitoxin MazE
MPSKLSRWGNSLGLRLPKSVTERRGLAAGDAMYVTLLENGLIVVKPVKPTEIPAGYAGLTQAAIPAETQQPKADKW